MADDYADLRALAEKAGDWPWADSSGSLWLASKARMDYVRACSPERVLGLLGAVPTWRPIETCPRVDAREYLVVTNRGIEIGQWSEWAKTFHVHTNPVTPTHWMPLPTPPKET